MGKRYLIVQQTNFGDCLYATTLAKQIKNDHPDSHITWVISPKCKILLHLNPFVDSVWDIPWPPEKDFKAGIKELEFEIFTRNGNREFDEIFFSQLPLNLINFTGTLRGTTLSVYKKPISVSVDPVIRLSPIEVENVKQFANRKNLNRFKNVILFECAPNSGQSRVNLSFAVDVSKAISGYNNDTCFILSSPNKLEFTNDHIIDGSELTYRENAELTHYCTHLVGCSSGLTWIATSDWAKKLPMVQLVDPSHILYVGVNFDFKINGIDNRQLIEMIDFDINKAIACITMVLNKEIALAKEKYNQEYRPTYIHMKNVAAILYTIGHGFFDVMRFSRRYMTFNKNLGNPISYNYFGWLLESFSLKLRCSDNIVIVGVKKTIKQILGFNRKL